MTEDMSFSGRYSPQIGILIYIFFRCIVFTISPRTQASPIGFNLDELESFNLSRPSLWIIVSQILNRNVHSLRVCTRISLRVSRSLLHSYICTKAASLQIDLPARYHSRKRGIILVHEGEVKALGRTYVCRFVFEA